MTIGTIILPFIYQQSLMEEGLVSLIFHFVTFAVFRCKYASQYEGVSVRRSDRAMFKKIVAICGDRSPGKEEQLPLRPLPNSTRICRSRIRPCWKVVTDRPTDGSTDCLDGQIYVQTDRLWRCKEPLSIFFSLMLDTPAYSIINIFFC